MEQFLVLKQTQQQVLLLLSTQFSWRVLFYVSRAIKLSILMPMMLLDMMKSLQKLSDAKNVRKTLLSLSLEIH